MTTHSAPEDSASSAYLYRRLLSYVRPYWRMFAVAVIGMVLFALSEPAMPAWFRPVIDGSFINKDPATIVWTPIILVVIFLVRGIGTFISSVGLNWIAQRVVMDLRKEMFNKLLVLPARYYSDTATGRTVSKATYDVTQVAQASTEVLLVLVQDGLALIGLLAWMFYLNWQLTLIMLAVTPLLIPVLKYANRRMRQLNIALQGRMGDLTHVLEETIIGHKVVKLFGGENYEQQRHDIIANGLRQLNVKVVATSAFLVPTVQLAAVVALALIVYIASYQAAQNHFTAGEFVSYFVATGLLFRPLKRLTKVNENLQRGLAAAGSVFALIDEPPEPRNGTVEISHLRGEIRFQQLSFAYQDDAPVLRELDLVIEPGETIALVGASGSGKTTLMNLIPRFIHPTQGRLLIDGVDIEEFDVRNLRSHISLVSQEVVLFNDTVRANIAYGALNQASEEQILEAARAAHVLEFVERMPQGLDTLIGESGLKLSGGQRQRLAIARAILKDAPILLLDEATSALDSHSERHIQEAVERLRSGRTTLVIAHRLSTIEHADRIVMMEHGRIVETGSHSELLAKKGRYRELHRLQLSTVNSAAAETQETP
ncbi:MAG: lipid A export permease/ATP-binding protein MsbA [Proteobacteria bacterium]|nr:MAG: lipid A export permease/ATP-binding protein MsbA [Pseudomonadota bacterium]QKK10236.1 MAG: lipid A export permease/ATP-binding protein MsbA [Pseudomonadota bacterium]